MMHGPRRSEALSPPHDAPPCSLDLSNCAVGAFRLHPARNAVTLDGTEFGIEPLVMDVLCYLVQRAGEVVTREEIIDHVWLDRPCGDESLTRAIAMLRRTFRKDESATDYIRTVWKRGYALEAPVRVRRAASPATASIADALVHPFVTDYSVAVLPFASMSATPTDAFLADGITRDLTMLLSRVPRLRVAAFSSVQTVGEGDVRLPDLTERLQVRYAVTGSIARNGDNFQLRAALMDGADDAQLWAQRFDAPLAQFYAVQDRIVLDVSSSLSSALQLAHAVALKGRRPFQLNAYQLVQRAEMLRLNYNRETAGEIVDLLERALDCDRADGAVHAALAVQHTQNVTSRFVDNPAETFSLAKSYLGEALALSPDDPEVLAAAGITASMMGNARRAVRFLTRAVERDPNNPHTLAVLGWQHCWLTGDADGVAMIRTAEERAPHHPRFALWAHYRGHAELRLGRVEEAITAYEEGQRRNPHYSLNLVTLAAALANAGREQEARRAIADLRQVAPEYRAADYEALVRRMVYWFGESPTGEEMIAAVRGIGL
ncbi:winged helix-turn-helix domain-containing protein [Aurantiacibacter spongiae]|nr:winged helix-turn-helix domain-containing protein [Aurantiacibacter spongiae]